MDHAVRLEKVIEDFDNFTPEYIKSICKIWLDFREFIGFLNEPDPYQYSNWMNYISWTNPFIVKATPTLLWEDGDKFKIGLDTGDEVNPNTTEPAITSEIVKFLSVEFAEFLVNHYRRGIFAYCGLDDCSRYIITTNGRKYCCESHKQAAYIKKLKNNKLKKEYRKIRVRLYRKYKRHPFLENKMSLEEFLLEKWPPEKIDLYHRFSRSSKK